MKSEIGRLLIKSAKEKGEKYSNPDRPQNYTQETFTLRKIIPLSDEIAWVYYEKRKGNMARALAIWTNRGKVNGKLLNGWTIFFPSDSHMLGLSKVNNHEYEIEEYNFGIYHDNYQGQKKEGD